VQANELLFRIYSPELDAKLAQAQAAEQAAVAMSDKAHSGLRTEEIEMARLDWQRALVQQQLAQTTLTRMSNLHQEGLIATQQLDEVKAQAKASTEQSKAAEARYTMAAKGARSEELRTAQAQSRQAAAAVAEVEAYRQELEVRAPKAGEVATLVIRQGELAPTGYPVVTLADLTDSWVIFNFREDKLSRFAVGKQFTATVPALAMDTVFVVTKLRALPSFASWKQAQGTPGYDLKTFQLEAKPVQPLSGLRAGMTVITELSPN
jgi:HlyD family secretion protein